VTDHPRAPFLTPFAERLRARVALHPAAVVDAAREPSTLREARALLRQETTAAVRCWALLVDAAALVDASQWADACSRLTEAVERAGLANDVAGRVEALRLLVDAVGNVDDARRLGQYASMLTRSLAGDNHPDVVVHAGIALARVEEGLGELPEARGRLEAMCEAITWETSPALAVRAHFAAARLAVDDGDPQPALAHLDASRQILAAHNDDDANLHLEHLTGVTLHALGRSDEALEHLRFAAAHAADPHRRLDAMLAEAEALSSLGSLDPAEAVLLAADALAGEAELPLARYQIAVRLAGLFAQRSRWREAWERQAEAAVWRERSRGQAPIREPADLSLRCVADALRAQRDAETERAELSEAALQRAVEERDAAVAAWESERDRAAQLARTARALHALLVENRPGAAPELPDLATVHDPSDNAADLLAQVDQVARGRGR